MQSKCIRFACYMFGANQNDSIDVQFGWILLCWTNHCLFEIFHKCGNVFFVHLKWIQHENHLITYHNRVHRHHQDIEFHRHIDILLGCTYHRYSHTHHLCKLNKKKKKKNQNQNRYFSRFAVILYISFEFIQCKNIVCTLNSMCKKRNRIVRKRFFFIPYIFCKKLTTLERERESHFQVALHSLRKLFPDAVKMMPFSSEWYAPSRND